MWDKLGGAAVETNSSGPDEHRESNKEETVGEAGFHPSCTHASAGRSDCSLHSSRATNAAFTRARKTQAI